MDIDDQFGTEHLYLTERECRVCKKTKDLINDFYRIRKNKYQLSSYSYECKECTKKRIIKSRKNPNSVDKWEYPDW
jgi:hypothetical protein